MSKFYKEVEIHGLKMGKAMELSRKNGTVEMLIKGEVVITLSPQEMKASRLVEIKKAEMRERGEEAEYMYIKALADFLDGDEHKASRLLREWEMISGRDRAMEQDEVDRAIEWHLRGTGYGGVAFKNSNGVALGGIALHKKFKLGAREREEMKAAGKLGMRGNRAFYTEKQKVQALDPREVMQFKGDKIKERMNFDRMLPVLRHEFVYNGGDSITGWLRVDRPLLLTEVGLGVYLEYLSENLRYFGLK